MRLTLAWLRNVVVVALSFALALYFVVAFGQQAWRARQLEAQVAERRAALAELVAERDALARQLSQLEGDAYRAYVERTARRELNLTYPGETVLLVQWREATPKRSRLHRLHSQLSSRTGHVGWMSFVFRTPETLCLGECLLLKGKRLLQNAVGERENRGLRAILDPQLVE